MGITELILDLAKKDGIEIGERRGLKKGELRGLKKGERRGLEKGEMKVKNTKNAIARQLKSLGISPAIISKSTGLTLRQISKL